MQLTQQQQAMVGVENLINAIGKLSILQVEGLQEAIRRLDYIFDEYNDESSEDYYGEDWHMRETLSSTIGMLRHCLSLEKMRQEKNRG